MNRRALLGAALALAPEIVMGAKSRKQGARRGKVLYDYTPDDVGPLIQRAMAAWGVPWEYRRRRFAETRPEDVEGAITVSTKVGELGGYNMTTFLGHGTIRVRILDLEPGDTLYSLILHELGHAIGLGDNREPDSAMNDSTYVSNTVPSEEDLRRARRLLR